MNEIVIATDGSSGARDAIDCGLELARDVDAVVAIVYVRHAPSRIFGAPYYQDVVTDEAEHARGVLADARLRAVGHDLDAEYVTLEGDAAESILDFARARDADLIVVGSRGLGRVAGALLGSVSREIVQRADRPVLVAKPRATVAAR